MKEGDREGGSEGGRQGERQTYVQREFNYNSPLYTRTFPVLAPSDIYSEKHNNCLVEHKVAQQ